MKKALILFSIMTMMVLACKGQVLSPGMTGAQTRTAINTAFSETLAVVDTVNETIRINGISVTAGAAEINILHGSTVNTAELNTLDGVLTTATELNRLVGVTSNIQTQLNSKAPSNSPTLITPLVTTAINPDTDDGARLGTSGTGFSDLYLASGAVIDFDAGDFTIAHTNSQYVTVTGDLGIAGRLDLSNGGAIETTGGNIDNTELYSLNGVTGSLAYSTENFGATGTGDIVLSIGPTLTTVNISDVIKLTPTADPPSGATEGMIYADTDHHLYYYNGTGWIQIDN